MWSMRPFNQSILKQQLQNELFLVKIELEALKKTYQNNNEAIEAFIKQQSELAAELEQLNLYIKAPFEAFSKKLQNFRSKIDQEKNTFTKELCALRAIEPEKKTSCDEMIKALQGLLTEPRYKHKVISTLLNQTFQNLNTNNLDATLSLLTQAEKVNHLTGLEKKCIFLTEIIPFLYGCDEKLSVTSDAALTNKRLVSQFDERLEILLNLSLIENEREEAKKRIASIIDTIQANNNYSQSTSSIASSSNSLFSCASFGNNSPENSFSCAFGNNSSSANNQTFNANSLFHDTAFVSRTSEGGSAVPTSRMSLSRSNEKS